MSTQTVMDLLGENVAGGGLGEDMTGADLYAGYIPERALLHIPPVQLGDGLAGPENDQPLQIFRDTRPLAVDELGMQGPFQDPKLARHRAGRQFPLNDQWNAGLDQTLPGRVPTQDSLHPSPLYPGQDPDYYPGVPPTEVLASPRTVFFTATPQVGWEGY
ncbi:MAG TPA: hypothetical protein VFP55_13660 [Solirubrobacteraceae bacterium]|nr:hypothetical protein [Solirubrobacteraceae bacterium]